MLRCFHLLRQLCRRYHVLAITYQDPGSFSNALPEYPELVNCRFLSADPMPRKRTALQEAIARCADAIRFRWWNRSFAGPANSHFLHFYPLLKRLLKRENIRAVIFEEISVIGLGQLVRRFDPTIRLVYDAHNVNTDIAGRDLSRGIISHSQYASIDRAEKTVYLNTPFLFACSRNDLDALVKLNAGRVQGIVVPNGTLLKPVSKVEAEENQSRRRIFFCGSLNYPPNQEGLTWFCREVLPEIIRLRPDAELHVAGSGNPEQSLEHLLTQPAIINHGYVKDLDTLYQSADIAIVPLLSGSGTRLKLLEAMAYAVPVVSTTIGAEGVTCTNGLNIIITDEPKSFAAELVRLLADEPAAKKMASSALDLIRNNYNWEHIGDTMNGYLEKLIS